MKQQLSRRSRTFVDLIIVMILVTTLLLIVAAVIGIKEQTSGSAGGQDYNQTGGTQLALLPNHA